MFEPVIASIAFAVFALIILGIGIAAAVRRRLSRRAVGDGVYRRPEPRDEESKRGSRAVNE